MSYIVMMRNPSANSGKLLALMDDGDSVCEFTTYPEAVVGALECPAARAWGFEVLKVNR